MADTMGSMFFNEPVQTEQGVSGMPNVTPSLILDRQLESLQGQFGQREQELQRQLKTGMYDQAGFVKELQKMQADFDEQFYVIEDKQNQLRQLDAMAQGGMMDEAQSHESRWGTVNPRGVQDVQFPNQPSERVPLSPKALEGQLETAGDYASAAESKGEKLRTQNRHWWMPRRLEGETRTQDSMIKQYDKWRGYIGYDNQSPGRQAQLDQVWDEHMGSNELYTWDPSHAKVTARRAKGRLGKAMSHRLSGTPTNTADAFTPVQKHIRTEVDKNKPKERRVKVVSPDGTEGSIPASRLNDYLSNGYERG